MQLSKKHREMLADLAADILTDYVMSAPAHYGNFDKDEWQWEPHRHHLENLIEDFIATRVVPQVEELVDVLLECAPPEDARMPEWLLEEIRGDMEFHRLRDEGLA